jgi:hypothetical protein
MEKWTPAANLQIVSDNLMRRLPVKKSQVKMRFLFSHFFPYFHENGFYQNGFYQKRFHPNLPANLHKNSPGFSNYLAHFFLQNPSLQPAFHRMPVEGGVI